MADGAVLRIFVEEARGGDEAEEHSHTARLCAWGLLGSTVSIGGLIILGSALPPGWFDHGTGRVRFISDGFEDYRWLPFLCLGGLGVVLACFVLFARMLCDHVAGVKRDWRPVGWAALASLAGFFLLSVVASGPAHIVGAGVFVAAYLVMHWLIDIILDQAHGKYSTTWERWAEYGLLYSSGVFAFAFIALLVCSIALAPEGAAFSSGSAIAEYLVFAGFLGINLHGVAFMLHIASRLAYSEDSGVYVSG